MQRPLKVEEMVRRLLQAEIRMGSQSSSLSAWPMTASQRSELPSVGPVLLVSSVF